MINEYKMYVFTTVRYLFIVWLFTIHSYACNIVYRVKFHFCVQYTELAVISGNHSYFLRIKCVGIWNVEGRKFSAACDIAFPKIKNLKCETRGFEVYFVRISVWIEVLVWFRRYRMHEKFIMKNLIFSSLFFSQIRP